MCVGRGCLFIAGQTGWRGQDDLIQIQESPWWEGGNRGASGRCQQRATSLRPAASPHTARVAQPSQADHLGENSHHPLRGRSVRESWISSVGNSALNISSDSLYVYRRRVLAGWRICRAKWLLLVVEASLRGGLRANPSNKGLKPFRFRLS